MKFKSTNNIPTSDERHPLLGGAGGGRQSKYTQFPISICQQKSDLPNSQQVFATKNLIHPNTYMYKLF